MDTIRGAFSIALRTNIRWLPSNARKSSNTSGKYLISQLIQTPPEAAERLALKKANAALQRLLA